MRLECFLLANLTAQEREALIAEFSPAETFNKGEELYRVGSLGLLERGAARITRLTESGISVTVRALSSGEIFGAAGVFGDWKGRSSVLATATCTVRYLSEETLQAVMRVHPQVAINYIAYLSDRIRFLNRRMDAFAVGDTVHKLYEFLCFQSDEEGVLQLNYGMAELARRLKMSRSSLYRSLDSLEQSGLIHRKKNQFTIV